VVTIGIRTHADPEQLTRAVTTAIAGIDPRLPVYDVAPLEQRLRREEAAVGFAALLINIYAALALTLAAIGVYGVLAFRVSSRIRELGIRAALGAEPAHLMGGIVRDGVKMVLFAIATGLAVSWLLGRSWQAMLFEVSATDMRLLGYAAVLLFVVGLAACAIPARRASRVDPIRALRAE
jgi:ABC-type antimicrobial peptide transport system permease subunit